WSPDSRVVVFEWFGMDLVSIDGRGLTQLGAGFDPAWSPMGTVPPRPPPAMSVSIRPADTTVTVGGSVRLEVIAKDAGGNVQPERDALWTTSDSTAAAQ